MDRLSKYSIKVVGSFDVLNASGVSIRPSGRKDCALLAMLALTRNHRQTRTWLQEKLWGDRAPAQGAASLRQSLSTLRSALNCDSEVIRADRTWIWLEPEHFSFDHQSVDISGEVLRGFDLREEGFNDWLRDVRAEHPTSLSPWGKIDEPSAPERMWFIEEPAVTQDHHKVFDTKELLCDRIIEALTVIGVHTIVDRRVAAPSLNPRVIDYVVRIRSLNTVSGCVLSITVTDGFGSLLYQVRRESDSTRWCDLKLIHVEIAQLFQDFAIRNEASNVRGAQWSAHANGCQALHGLLVPGAVPVEDIKACSEAAIATNEQGIYHALLGFSHLRVYGEREGLTAPDIDVVLQSFRTALSLSPGNGLVQALAGHSYGFLSRDLDRNSDMTREAVRLLPGSGICWMYRAISLVYCRRYLEALKAAKNATILCQGTIGQSKAYAIEQYARLMVGDLAGAIRSGERSLEIMFQRPTVMDLMTAYTMSGKTEEGQRKLQILMNREPDLSVEMFRSDEYPIVNPEHRDVTVHAVRQLGLR